ncbi:MAG: DUF2924 domain-containing protein [Candidatus Omnitrophota bacterium]
MSENAVTKITELKSVPLYELQKKYKEAFGDNKRPSNNKVHLWRKIAYRNQELEFGGLSEKVKSKLDELIQKYEPVNNPLLRPESENTPGKRPSRKNDRRLPIPGSIITKNYKGQKIMVKVLENGFEYNGKIYKTLSSVASLIGGNHWNGYQFFRL